MSDSTIHIGRVSGVQANYNYCISQRDMVLYRKFNKL